MSHPSRVRGLKYYLRHDAEVLHTVAPFTGAWIEIPCHQRIDLARRLSHPSRVRGLKSIPFVAVGIARMVAPFTGAWIEILALAFVSDVLACRTLHGCVD